MNTPPQKTTTREAGVSNLYRNFPSEIDSEDILQLEKLLHSDGPSENIEIPSDPFAAVQDLPKNHSVHENQFNSSNFHKNEFQNDRKKLNSVIQNILHEKNKSNQKFDDQKNSKTPFNKASPKNNSVQFLENNRVKENRDAQSNYKLSKEFLGDLNGYKETGQNVSKNLILLVKSALNDIRNKSSQLEQNQIIIRGLQNMLNKKDADCAQQANRNKLNHQLINELRAVVKSQKDENQQLTNKIDEIQKLNKDAELMKKEVQKAHTRLTKDQVLLKDENDAFADLLSEKDGQIADLSKKNDLIRDEISKHESRSKDYENKICALKTELKSKNEMINKLNDELNVFIESKFEKKAKYYENLYKNVSKQNEYLNSELNKYIEKNLLGSKSGMKLDITKLREVGNNEKKVTFDLSRNHIDQSKHEKDAVSMVSSFCNESHKPKQRHIKTSNNNSTSPLYCKNKSDSLKKFENGKKDLHKRFIRTPSSLKDIESINKMYNVDKNRNRSLKCFLHHDYTPKDTNKISKGRQEQYTKNIKDTFDHGIESEEHKDKYHKEPGSDSDDTIFLNTCSSSDDNILEKSRLSRKNSNLLQKTHKKSDLDAEEGSKLHRYTGKLGNKNKRSEMLKNKKEIRTKEDSHAYSDSNIESYKRSNFRKKYFYHKTNKARISNNKQNMVNENEDFDSDDHTIFYTQPEMLERLSSENNIEKKMKNLTIGCTEKLANIDDIKKLREEVKKLEALTLDNLKNKKLFHHDTKNTDGNFRDLSKMNSAYDTNMNAKYRIKEDLGNLYSQRGPYFNNIHNHAMFLHKDDELYSRYNINNGNLHNANHLGFQKPNETNQNHLQRDYFLTGHPNYQQTCDHYPNSPIQNAKNHQDSNQFITPTAIQVDFKHEKNNPFYDRIYPVDMGYDQNYLGKNRTITNNFKSGQNKIRFYPPEKNLEISDNKKTQKGSQNQIYCHDSLNKTMQKDVNPSFNDFKENLSINQVFYSPKTIQNTNPPTISEDLRFQTDKLFTELFKNSKNAQKINPDITIKKSPNQIKELDLRIDNTQRGDILYKNGKDHDTLFFKNPQSSKVEQNVNTAPITDHKNTTYLDENTMINRENTIYYSIENPTEINSFLSNQKSKNVIEDKKENLENISKNEVVDNRKFSPTSKEKNADSNRIFSDNPLLFSNFIPPKNHQSQDSDQRMKKTSTQKLQNYSKSDLNSEKITYKILSKNHYENDQNFEAHEMSQKKTILPDFDNYNQISNITFNESGSFKKSQQAISPAINLQKITTSTHSPLERSNISSHYLKNHETTQVISEDDSTTSSLREMIKKTENLKLKFANLENKLANLNIDEENTSEHTSSYQSINNILTTDAIDILNDPDVL